jgi:hypothetical protein
LTDPNNDYKQAKETLHKINARVQADPSHKLDIIKTIYAECSGSDADAADMALIVKDIVEAGGNAMDQTTHLKTATPVLMVGMALGGVMSIAAIIVGGYAIYKGSTGATEIHLFGNTISTQTSGVALVFIGALCLVFIIRKAFKVATFSKL